MALKSDVLIRYPGPALVTTKDAGDAVTLLQSLAGSTFDSSQLVLTACMGYQNVNEARLEELRNKHRPAVKAAVEERFKGLRVWRDCQGLASKLSSFEHDPGSVIVGTTETDKKTDEVMNSDASNYVDELHMNLSGNVADSAPDLQEQVTFFLFSHSYSIEACLFNFLHLFPSSSFIISGLRALSSFCLNGDFRICFIQLSGMAECTSSELFI